MQKVFPALDGFSFIPPDRPECKGMFTKLVRVHSSLIAAGTFSQIPRGPGFQLQLYEDRRPRLF